MRALRASRRMHTGARRAALRASGRVCCDRHAPRPSPAWRCGHGCAVMAVSSWRCGHGCAAQRCDSARATRPQRCSSAGRCAMSAAASLAVLGPGHMAQLWATCHPIPVQYACIPSMARLPKPAAAGCGARGLCQGRVSSMPPLWPTAAVLQLVNAVNRLRTNEMQSVASVFYTCCYDLNPVPLR
jgi:hypothetical protein